MNVKKAVFKNIVPFGRSQAATFASGPGVSIRIDGNWVVLSDGTREICVPSSGVHYVELEVAPPEAPVVAAKKGKP